MSKLEPCPFCGGEADFERLGTNSQSCIIICTNCGCRLESNETGEWCGEQWNRRKYALTPIGEPPLEEPAIPDPESVSDTIRVPVEVVKSVDKLHFVTLVLVLVTGIQAGNAITQLLVRFNIIGGGS